MNKMKKNIQRHIAPTGLRQGLVVLCGLLLGACRQEELPEIRDNGDEISFRTTETLTRGFIDDSNLGTAGTRISMYGYHKGNILGGASKPLAGKPLAYGTYGDETASRWSIVDDSGNPVTYYWQGDGEYKFFGWLIEDAAHSKLTAPFTPTFDATAKTLAIPETALDKDYNQFDFLYSEVVNRTVSGSQGKEAVPLSMNHLFTAFSIGFKNYSEDPITITRVALEGVHENGSATIDFGGNGSVSYGATSTARAEGSYFASFSGSHEVPGMNKDTGVTYGMNNVFDPAATAKTYYMLWPQAASIVSPTTPDTNPDDEREYAASDSILIFEYELGGVPYNKRVKLPAEAWEAGKKYTYELQVTDKLVELVATVTPWDYIPSDIDFKDNTVTVKSDGHVKWDEESCIVDHEKQQVYVMQGQPVEATFCIDAPQGGQWRVSLEGDVTAFEVMDDAAPTDDGFGPIDGQVHRIRIVPKISSPDRDYKVTLRFVAITADSKTLPIDDMVQDNDNDDKADVYTIILRKA